MLPLLLNNEACLLLDCNIEVFFPLSFIEVRTWKGRKGNFFEEQNALEIILGCFLDSFFVWAGEAMLELCSEGGRLMHCSKMLL